MVNQPNRKTWQRGDTVIHDRDAKEHKMLRVVTKVLPGGEAFTAFRFKNELPAGYRDKVEKFPMRELLDPRRFPELRAGRSEVTVPVRQKGRAYGSAR